MAQIGFLSVRTGRTSKEKPCRGIGLGPCQILRGPVHKFQGPPGPEGQGDIFIKNLSFY